MPTLTIRISESLADEIEAESRERKVSKSDVVRERLESFCRPGTRDASSPLAKIADLIGSVDGLPDDLSARKKLRLESSGYGRSRPRR